ncbi:hypothetical protein AVEN_141799-1 [Araneus ventricosus]|uniref:Uncharacterized protein n=1 Tax=Araneus ventricosus TaxID=182803 RepID=A0A4Y2E6F0_ARAVE|nr:hypothetical protein AVEN_141799-1 [Araneus ventricosus]
MLNLLQRGTIHTFIWIFRRRNDGPAPFSGKIGKQLANWEKLPIINFEATELVEININKTDLSKDQLCLLDIIRAIQKGECSPDLAARDPGSLSHSRWLTCAILVLCFLTHKQALQSNSKCLLTTL